MKNLCKIILLTIIVSMWHPSVSQADNSWPGKRSTGLSVAKANQKQSVRANKKNRKGLRKASRIVNARLSEKAYGKQTK